MSTAVRNHHEPEENPAQAAALLADLVATIRHHIDTAIRNGLTGELRQVLAKFPELQASPPPAPAVLGPDIDTLIGLSNSAYRLDDHARRAKPGSPNHSADATCAAFLRNEIEKLKSRTT